MIQEKVTIDATPTWEGITPWLIHILKDGNKKSKEIAEAEIFKMAKLADKYVESLKQQEA